MHVSVGLKFSVTVRIYDLGFIYIHVVGVSIPVYCTVGECGGTTIYFKIRKANCNNRVLQPPLHLRNLFDSNKHRAKL